mmetsp:Transcript_18728/g.46030  ORF Transcript_18728/g.46030 Transcript_18728/m.46030 type:complete len:169 (+) Transcript_18728:257-763(+)
MKAVLSDRVAVVATYDNVAVKSPSQIFQLPSVISLKEYKPVLSRRPAFSRFNVFLRDDFCCQYCGKRSTPKNLTFDHVVPSCRGGKRNWTNIATACIPCNHSKGRKLVSEMPHMELRAKPREPTVAELSKIARKYPPRRLHDTWVDFLYWDAPMQLEVEDASEYHEHA